MLDLFYNNICTSVAHSAMPDQEDTEEETDDSKTTK